MLRNYLLIALRNLRRHRAYTFITVTGLAVGMACCFFILLFVRDELIFDRFHANADRTYRIVSDWGDFSIPSTNLLFLNRFTADYPEITTAQLMPYGGLVGYEDRTHSEEGLFFANPEVFDVFTLPLRSGNPETALERPNTAVITPEMAQRYFGDENPVGKKLLVNPATQFEVEITGVIEPMPAHSHIHYQMLTSWATLDAVFDFSNNTDWGNNSIYAYLLLPDGRNPKTLEAQLPDFLERHAGEDWNGSVLSLQPLTDIHLRSHHNMELEPNGDVAYVYVFSVIAVFILLIACVNFMNLATARSEERAREVGVRKVMGAHRRQLVSQFLAESTLLSVFALIVAVALVTLLLPAFRTLTGKALDVAAVANLPTVLVFLLVALLAGVFAGSYPAFFLSSYGPIAVLRGHVKRGSRGALLRKGLVVFQFATSVVLIVGTLVVYRQLEHLRTANVGFEQELVVTIPIESNDVQTQYGTFKSRLLQEPGIASVTISGERLPSELLDGDGIKTEGMRGDSTVSTRTVAVGHDFFETLGVEMVAGRAFSLEFPSDSSAFILNETAFQRVNAARMEPFASPAEAIGKELSSSGERRGPIVGIVKDFNMSSLHEAIEPVTFAILEPRFDTFMIRVRPGNAAHTVATLERVWRQVYPDWPFAYSFADQAFDAQYRAEERIGRIFTVFAGLAVLIACLGLFGLAAYTAEQRRKEIGVRKVLGASVAGLVLLLTKEFVRLVGIALVIAAPLAWFAMNRWLQDFAYRIEIGPLVFLAAGLAALAIAVLTVSYQAIRAASADPVKSLRYE